MSGIEVAGAVLGAIPLIISALEEYQSFTEGKSGQTTVQPETPHICHLRVYDLDFGSGANQRLVGQSNSRGSLKDDLDSLPPQDARFRVYVVEKVSVDQDVLLAHLSSRGCSVAARPLDGAEDTFEALASQWRESNGTSYKSTMYSYKISAQEYGAKDARINQGLAFLAGLIRLNMSIRVSDIAGSDDKSIVTILCEGLTSPIRERYIRTIKKHGHVWVDGSWNAVTETLDRVGRHLLQSNKLCEQTPPLFQSAEELKKYLLLRYCGATLDHYNRFLSTVKREYVLERESIMDPRFSILRPSVLEEITADAYVYRDLHDIALDLTSPVLDLIVILESALSSPSGSKQFKAFTAELQCQCKDITKTTTRFSSRLDHNMKYLDVSRNMQESLRVWVLSALASLFLPLSIATGLLSMQSRFIDLHVLLYDFCGVVVLVGTVLILSFQLLRGYVHLKEDFRTWMPTSKFQNRTKIIIESGAAVSVAVFGWALILASFLVGMIKDTRLGGKILGIGLATLTAWALVWFGLFMSFAAFADRVFGEMFVDRMFGALKGALK